MRGMHTDRELTIQSMQPQPGTSSLGWEFAPTIDDPLSLLLLIRLELDIFWISYPNFSQEDRVRLTDDYAMIIDYVEILKVDK